MFLIFLLLVITYYLISYRRNIRSLPALIPFIILAMLFFNFYIISRSFSGEALEIVDNSYSMSRYKDRMRSSKVIEDGQIQTFKGIMRGSSPINSDLITLCLYSGLSGKKVSYNSDFNFTDQVLYNGNFPVKLIPEKNFAVMKNSITVFSLSPGSMIYDAMAPVIISIFSKEDKEVTYRSYLDGAVLETGSWNLIEGMNLRDLKLRPLAPGTYNLQVFLDTGDEVSGDDGANRDIIVLKAKPEVVIVYRYPSADIGTVSRTLKYLGCEPLPTYIGKAAPKNADGIIYYDLPAAMRSRIPVMHIGMSGLAETHRSAICVSGGDMKIKSEFTLAGLDIFGKYDHFYYFSKTGFHVDEIKNTDSALLEELTMALEVFVTQLKMDRRVELSQVIPHIGEEVFISSDMEIRNIKISGGEARKLENGFSFTPREDKIEVEMECVRNNTAFTVKRKYFALSPLIEELNSGFNEEKYQTILRKFSREGEKKKYPRNSVHPFSTLPAMIIALLGLVWLWLKH